LSVETIAVVDGDLKRRVGTVQALTEQGFVAFGAAEVDKLVDNERTPIVVVLWVRGEDQLRGQVEALSLQPRLAGTPFVVVSGDELDAATAFDCGAADYLAAEAGVDELGARIRVRLRRHQTTMPPSSPRRHAEAVIELTQKLSSTLELRELFYLLVKRVSELIGSTRVSIVLGDSEDETGFVVAASDDERLRDLPIELPRYPEIKRVLETGQPFVVEDARNHPLFQVTETNVPERFRSLSLFPITFEDRVMGVLFLRFVDVRALDAGDWFTLRALANAAGIALRNARLLTTLREQSRRSESAHVEAERQLEVLRRYVDFFDSLADGIVVLGQGARVLFCNPAACVACGRSEEELRQEPFDRILTKDGKRRFGELQASFKEGLFPHNVDLPIRTAAGDRRILNVSFSSVLHEHDGVIVSLRDVTEDRALEREHNKTQEFLQRVIDSSVDAIVSADMRGNVLLFNPAAERTYGYEAEEVVGKRNVRELYPDGVAVEIMKHIRAEAYGGPGVLHGFETELLGKGEKHIPVMLSAALIMHRGRPIGSVGVFKDLRDLIRIEERLHNAQRELADREQKAFIAELAGATAHELNQPLTTVMGYAEMLRKELEQGTRLERACSAIVRESERMAEIVRKIGKLTKFESKAYVGDTKIIDIERSIDSEPPVDGR